MTKPDFEPWLVIAAGIAALATIALGLAIAIVYGATDTLYTDQPPLAPATTHAPITNAPITPIAPTDYP